MMQIGHSLHVHTLYLPYQVPGVHRYHVLLRAVGALPIMRVDAGWPQILYSTAQNQRDLPRTWQQARSRTDHHL